MLDRDLAILFDVKRYRLNKQTARNPKNSMNILSKGSV
jgi:hypothetical protein